MLAGFVCLFSSIEINGIACVISNLNKYFFAITLLTLFFMRMRFLRCFSFLSNGTNAVPVTLLMTSLFVIATRTAFVIAGITIRSLFIC